MMMQNSTTGAAAAVSLIIALTAAQCLINVKKLHRGRQAMLPFVAIAVSVLCTAAAIYLFNQIQALSVQMRELAEQLRQLDPTQQFNPQSVDAPTLYKKFCSENGVNGNIILYLNAAIMIVFTVIKAILCPIVNKVWAKDSLMMATSSGFYEQDEFSKYWFVKRERAGLRKILLGMTVGAAIFSVVILTATAASGPEGKFWAVCFPVTALIIIAEAWCYLNGKTKEEYLSDIGGDSAEAERISDFYRIREVYEKLFPSQIIAAHSGYEYSSHKGATKVLRTMAESDDPVERNVSLYFSTYGNDKRFNVDCVCASNEMMHGKNVIFYNPFYRDLEPYLTLPMIDALINNKKCLVIAGRSSTAKDAGGWLSDLMARYSHLKYMWRVLELGVKEPECEIGILSFRQLYDVDVLAANRDFFSEVGFVLLLEPSVIVNTGQVGLSIIADETRRYGKDPVFCVCDRFTDGLVDTMSHVLKTEITTVVAAPVPRCVYTGMAFKANGDFMGNKLFDRQTCFMGNGTELAAVAVKNQVPNVTWYAETKAPVRDIKWIVGQHFSSVCKYMNLPTQQRSLDEAIRFVPNLWSTKRTKEQFLIVEDEFCNIFSTMRTFLSRGDAQVFVNVLSENYLLRDYMRCNQDIFMSNPGAIPSLVPDYARTERNGLMKLLILMAFRPMSEAEVINELELSGCSSDDVYSTIAGLISKYTFAKDTTVDVKAVSIGQDMLTAQTENFYSIPKITFDKNFADSLKNAYFIVEDEKRGTEYIDAKLFGYVTQVILPGQFVTYDGKYYQVKSISPELGVVLRRASELYDGRKYYRQLRSYKIDSLDKANTVSARQISDLELSVVTCDFSVETTGYLEMDDLCDLRTAKEIRFDGDPAAKNYNRSYKNKDILLIKLPGTDEKQRFTLCVLLNEMFRSIFPDAWQYVTAVSSLPDEVNGMLGRAVYSICGEIENEYIYVIEDSSIDLGLLDAVSKNLPQLFRLVTDFLDWHFEKMKEVFCEDPPPPPIEVPEPEEVVQKEHQSRLQRLFARLFGKKDKNKDKGKSDEPEKPVEPEPENKPDDEDKDESDTQKTPEIELDTPEKEDDDRPEAGDGSAEIDDNFRQTDDDENGEVEQPSAPETEQNEKSDATENEHQKVFVPENMNEEDDGIVTSTDDELIVKDDVPDNLDILMPIEQTRYQKECYLKFGFEEIDSKLCIDEVYRYLNARGWSDSTLRKARKHNVFEEMLLDMDAECICDFCGLPISGVSYERLNDGRVRCNDCAASAIDSVEEFRNIYNRTLQFMGNIYGISIKNPINVKTTDAKTIASFTGGVFVPTNDFDGRVLGFARNDKGRFSLYVENGAPMLAATETIAHELTHIWQFLNWNEKELLRIYAQDTPEKTMLARDIIYEGMATWAATQVLYSMGEVSYARKQELMQERRTDVYGIGFCLFRDRYRFVKDSGAVKYIPFNGFPPLDPIDVKNKIEEVC